MSDTPSLPTPRPGSINWVDLTVPDAAVVRDFYHAVVGWEAAEVEMGGYQDYAMFPAGAGAPVAGICHARGPNTGLPTQWLVYVNVADLDASLEAVAANGGELVGERRDLGPNGRFAVVRDPAGAVFALYQPADAD